MSSERPYIVAAVVASAMSVILIWSFRFLPVADYPVWLFEAKILGELSNPFSEYHRYYELVIAPVPNLTFTLFAWLVGSSLTLEAAGKIFLSICAICFPWGVWYSVRSLAPSSPSAVSYIGFPYAMSYFLLGSQNYIFALALLLWLIGYFIPRAEDASLKHLAVLSVGLLFIYFTHGIIFFLAVGIFLGVVLERPANRARKVSRLIYALMAPVSCALWYSVSQHSELRTTARWDLLSLARNVLKPFMPFIKSYGAEIALPLTILNGLWVCLVGILLVIIAKRAWTKALFDRRFALPLILCVAMILFLPDPTLGVVQPGARFGLPLLLLLVLSTARVRINSRWRVLFLGVTFVVMGYNWLYFTKFNSQATSFYDDLVGTVDFKRPFYTIGLDWPAGSSFWDKGSPSVNGISFVPMYGHIQEGGVSWIFETGILRGRQELHREFPEIQGSTIHEYYESIFRQSSHLRYFNSIAVVGAGEPAHNAVRRLEEFGFRARLSRPVWTIFESQ